MPTSIFIGRPEKPALPNAGWFANLADLPGTFGKIGTFETQSDVVVTFYSDPTTQRPLLVTETSDRQRQIRPLSAGVSYIIPWYRKYPIVPMQIGIPYGSSIMRGFRSAAMRDSSVGFLMTIHSLRMRRKFS